MNANVACIFYGLFKQILHNRVVCVFIETTTILSLLNIIRKRRRLPNSDDAHDRSDRPRRTARIRFCSFATPQWRPRSFRQETVRPSPLL